MGLNSIYGTSLGVDASNHDVFALSKCLINPLNLNVLTDTRKAIAKLRVVSSLMGYRDRLMKEKLVSKADIMRIKAVYEDILPDYVNINSYTKKKTSINVDTTVKLLVSAISYLVSDVNSVLVNQREVNNSTFYVNEDALLFEVAYSMMFSIRKYVDGEMGTRWIMRPGGKAALDSYRKYIITHGGAMVDVGEPKDPLMDDDLLAGFANIVVSARNVADVMTRTSNVRYIDTPSCVNDLRVDLENHVKYMTVAIKLYNIVQSMVEHVELTSNSLNMREY